MAGPGSFAADCHICRITLCGLIPQSVIFHKGRLRPEDDDDRMKHPVLEMIESAMEPFGRMPVLAAVSGGADSVCLLMALRELGYEVSAVHVEHGIRGEESLEDCAFVRGLCAENRIPLSVVSVDAPSSARSLSMTLEEAARLERRRAYRETAQRLGIEVVATAHHRMDQAETVLWRQGERPDHGPAASFLREGPDRGVSPGKRDHLADGPDECRYTDHAQCHPPGNHAAS